MIQNRELYDQWASLYDTNKNYTRDVEAVAMRNTLQDIDFRSALEAGCGTGKNSEWLAKRCEDDYLAVDFSAEMIARAKKRVKKEEDVRFVQADLTREWNFTNETFDLIVFSLVLEHMANMDFVISEAVQKLNKNGHIYIGELHPFKQYEGSLARFDNDKGERVELQCYTHHVSDFMQLAKKYNLTVVDLNEWFDDDDNNKPPRVLTVLLKKNS